MYQKKIAVIWLSMAILFSFVMIIVEIPTSVKAGTIWVDDSYPTEDPTHKKTIQAGVDAAQSGDTVYVYNGTYYENVIIDKTINLTGEDKNTTIIDGNGSEDVIYVIEEWVNITGFTITNSGFSWGDAAIQVDSNYDTIYDNIIISNNWYGIFIFESSEHNISFNIISSNLMDGIMLWYSVGTIITGNIMVDNGLFIYGNLLKYWNTHNIDTSNIVNGKPFTYWKNQNQDMVPSDLGQVILANCTDITIDNQQFNNCSVGIEVGFSSNVTISNNTISNNSEGGIYLYSSSENGILNNTVSNNWNGIYLHTNCNTNVLEYNSILSNKNIGFYISSSNNNIIKYNNCSFNDHTGFYFANSNGKIIRNNICSNNLFYGFHFQLCDDNIIENNTISNNTLGLYFWSSSINEVYHNNFINNTTQAIDSLNDNYWDAGYPSGGNYWSDYNGVDNYKGSNQDQPGNDGIGDTNYSIDSDSVDNYPLMERYSYKPFENYTILKQGWNLISIPLIQNNQGLKKVLEMIDGYYDAVQWYDITDSNDHWKHYKVGKPFGNDLYELNESIGFWIHITQPGDTIFVYNGTQPTVNQTIPLFPGWNLVGYPSLNNKNRTDALNNIDFGSDVDAIWTYNATTQTWKEITASDNFEVGRGYWMHSKVTKTWVVPL